jgi:hypothetical protein
MSGAFCCIAMARIKLKNSQVKDKAPLATDLDVGGEIAVNHHADNPGIFLKDTAGAVRKIAGPGSISTSAATEAAAGIVELATLAETATGTDATRAVHPAGLKALLSATLTPGSATAPAGPATGATYIDSSVSPAVVAVWDGAAWVKQVGTATTSATAPTAPVTGQVYLDTSTSPAVAKLWNGAAWINLTTDTAVQSKLDAQLGGIWTRTGTVVSPANAGNAVDIDFPLGTAALPGLTPVGDPNTGLWAPAADTLALSTNGTEKVRVTPAGLVGVGTSNPGGSESTEDNAGNTLAATLDINGNLLFSSTAPYIKPITKTQNGRSLYIQAGDTSETNYNGGHLYLEAGGQDPSWGGAAKGGNVYIDGGQKGGIGTDGNIILGSTRGRVGIGTTTAGATLDVKAAAATPPLIVQGPSSEFARLDSSGRLLVGTSAARTNLGKGVQSARLQVEGTSGDGARIAQVSNGNNPNGIQYIFAKSRGTAVGSNIIVQSNDDIGVLSFEGSDGTNFVPAAQITGSVDGAPGANDMPGRLVFSVTQDTQSSPTEALRITNDRVRCYNQAAPAAVDTTATLTVGNLKTGIITSSTAAAVTMTLPTGTDTEAGFSGVYTNMTFEWTVINTGATNAVTVQGGTGHTLVGSGAVAAGVSGRFASRRTASNTFVTYRLS